MPPPLRALASLTALSLTLSAPFAALAQQPPSPPSAPSAPAPAAPAPSAPPASPPASSAPPSPAIQALITEATALLQSGRAAEACPKLEAAQRLAPAVSTQIQLADCYEKTNRPATAWITFTAAAAAAKSSSAPDPEREALARQRAAALEPRLPRMIIAVSPAIANLPRLEITRDGAVVPPSLWNVPFPIDPGEHTITATAPGKQDWQIRGTTADRTGADTITVPALVDLPPPPTTAALPPPTAVAPAPRKSLVPPIVLGVLATASLGAGIGLSVSSSSKRSQALDLDHAISSGGGSCVTDKPDDRCATLFDTAHSVDNLHNLSIATFVTGGVLVASVIAYVVWPVSRTDELASTRPRTKLRASPVVGAGHGGMILSGSF